MKTKLITILFLTLLVVPILAGGCGKDSMPKQLGNCPVLPQEANYAFAYAQTYNSVTTIFFIACTDYYWSKGTFLMIGTKGTQYWIWGKEKGKKANWWEVEGAILQHNILAIYNKTGTIIWDYQNNGYQDLIGTVLQNEN